MFSMIEDQHASSAWPPFTLGLPVSFWSGHSTAELIVELKETIACLLRWKRTALIVAH